MKLTKLFFKTLKENPVDADAASHRLMIRASMMKKLASGIYVFMPLGWRVIRKIMNIVREEMERVGAQEIRMPALQPKELWQETGRDEAMNDILMKIQDRNERQFYLGPTHEEVVTDLVRHFVKSYRQLPVTLYQIQTKFRDEPRPRFGIIRAREFIMKDAYSFERSEEELEASYIKMYEAYHRIFSRCGLNFKAVEALTGAIGGSVSHEFMVLADTGEDGILSCENCHYAANLEKAEGMDENGVPHAEEAGNTMEKVHTPNQKTVENVCKYLQVSSENLVKTLIFHADEYVVAALVRGDQELNVEKLKNVLGCASLEMAGKETVEKLTGALVGFSGPVGLKNHSNKSVVKIVADEQVKNMKNFVTGANESNAHFKNVNLKDFSVDTFANIRLAREGDTCVRCKKGLLKFSRGIEVGHIFKLGTKYSKAMRAVYLDDKGEEKPIIMGCYGIGITRIAAAVIEQQHDKDGMIWPESIAPFRAVVLLVGNSEKQTKIAEELYEMLQAKGVEVLLDDRNERAGVKFKDADLLGIPYHFIVGEKAVESGKIEVKKRSTGERSLLEKADVVKLFT